MSDEARATAAPAPPATAGAMLRQARQAQGLHIAALAATIKVTPRKLEFLESDQLDQLPDATFARALAQTVCRTLKIDAAPILALLPPAGARRLDATPSQLNMPYRDRPGRSVPKQGAGVGRPALWIAALLLVAAVAVYVVPGEWLSFQKEVAALGPSASPAVPRSAAPASAAASVVPAAAAVPNGSAASAAASADELTTSQPSQEAVPVAAADMPASEPMPGILQLHATAQSWVEVTDAHGQALLSRVVEPGENVGLDGVTPLKLKIGNAGATRVVFRGQPLALAAFTRDNVARLELK